MISVVFVEYIFLEGIGDTNLKPHSSLGLGRERTTTQKLFSPPPKTPSHRDPMQKLGTASLIPGYRNKYQKKTTVQSNTHIITSVLVFPSQPPPLHIAHLSPQMAWHLNSQVAILKAWFLL